MNTTYDMIYKKFKTITRSNNYNLPQTEQEQYELIHTGINLYNSRDEKNIKYDDVYETVDVELLNWQILVIANFMKWIFLNNMLTERSTMLMPFTKEIGIKNIQSQLKSIKTNIDIVEQEIDALLFQNEEYEGDV